MSDQINMRECALNVLMEIDAKKEYSHILIRNVLEKYDYLDINEKAFFKRLTEGTIERQIQLDYILNLFSKVPVNKMKPLIRSLLRMSVYQLLFMDHVPDSAVCNEAVKLASKRKFASLKGFVNGVLRRIAREKSEIVYPDAEKESKKYLSVWYSMPEWIVEKWMKELSTETTRALLEAFLMEHPITIRMDENLTEKEKQALLNKMEEKQIKAFSHPLLPYAYQLKNTEGASQIPGFLEGSLTIQDVSSMLVCEAAGITKDKNIIDVCAAPGGKSLHAACKLKTSGHVLARDVSDRKIAQIAENIERMHQKNITAEVYDATILDESKIGTADIVLADVPCSGLGVMGKKRDIKYHSSVEQIESLILLQREILKNAVSYVKPGGVLLFSTCTINKQENEENVEWLMQNFPLHTEDLRPYLPTQIKAESLEKGFLQLLPQEYDTDGFFLARLVKNKE